MFVDNGGFLIHFLVPVYKCFSVSVSINDMIESYKEVVELSIHFMGLVLIHYQEVVRIELVI